MVPAKEGAQPAQLRVLLAEASPVVRHRFRKRLEGLPSIAIVGEVATDHEALNLSFRLQPQVVVLSASLPDQGGFEVLRLIKGALPNCQVIIMSFRPCGFIEKAARLLGATAVCPIDDGLTQLCDVLRCALKTTPDREAS